MKVVRFNNVKGYKSFGDFLWSKYCMRQDNQGNCLESKMTRFTVFFGENGSGKSSLCDILKNLSGQREFQLSKPESAEIVVEDNNKEQQHSFNSGKWDNLLPSTSILFFDIDFINANIHTNGVRSSNLQSGAHTQKSGKLIIDLDQKANALNLSVNKAKDDLDLFDKTNGYLIGQKYTDIELKLYEEYIKNKELDIPGAVAFLETQRDKVAKELTTLEKLQLKSSDIQKIQAPAILNNSVQLSQLNIYQEIFNRVIEKKVNLEVDQKIKDHFEKHKVFIESAKDKLPEDYSNSDCPLCMQPLKNAAKVIEFYRSVYDKSFEASKKQYLDDIDKLHVELLKIKQFLESIGSNVIHIFNAYETIKNDFELVDIYNVEEKSVVLGLVEKFNSKPIDDFLVSIEGLKRIDKVYSDPTKQHEGVAKLIEEINSFLVVLNEIINKRNKLIEDLKTKYTDTSKIQLDIVDAKNRQLDINSRIEFLTRGKLTKITELKDLNAKRQLLLEAKKVYEKERDDYITQKIPENIIGKMIAVLDKFNLNFTIEPFKSSSTTKDYAFAFKIKDKHGHERELKDGLSEGERQLISLSFFFAINDNVSDKKSKILVFDDPITSLDAPNLKILAELIHSQISDYSQVIVFTHHPLFHKYLIKPDISDKAKFGVLKNSELFGGSFIFSDPSYDMIDEVKLCNQEISSKATSGNLKLEEISLKYGQLLRLAVEKFIKHELLMWNKEGDFGSQIVCNLKSSKSKITKLTEGDLDTITNIYSYCNQSNLLHVDKENPSALSELINNIDRFVSILDKSRN